MARGGLSLVRDALVTATVYDVIDDNQFVLLYDVYSPRSGNSPNSFDSNTLSERSVSYQTMVFQTRPR